MKYGSIQGIRRDISRIVLGTSGMRSYEQAAPLLDSYAAQGGTCLDTAFVYGQGLCETVVGQWLRKNSSVPVLVGKGAHPPRCDPESVAEELSVSLDRLGVDRIDIYLVHRDNPQVPVSEWVEALEAQVAAGRISAYGGSNWSTTRLRAVNAYARAAAAAGFVALSNHFSLAQMAEPLYPGCVAFDEDDVVTLGQSGVALLPWASQARGFFSDTDPGLLDPNMRRCWDTERNRQRRRRAEATATATGTRTINIALAFVLAQPASMFPVIGPRTETELRVALKALDVELSPDVVRWLVRDGGIHHAHLGNEAGP